MFNINAVYNAQMGNVGDTDGATIEVVRVIDTRKSILGGDLYVIATKGGVGIATPAPHRWGHPEGTMLYCTTLYPWDMVKAIVANFGTGVVQYKDDPVLEVLVSSERDREKFNQLARVA